MNNLLQYILNFMSLDYGFEVYGVVAGGDDGNGVRWKVTQSRNGYVTITATNGKIKTTASETKDGDWGAAIQKKCNEIHALERIDVEKIAGKLRQHFLENREKFLKEISKEEWKN